MSLQPLSVHYQMGQYFQIVNVTKRQRVDPDRLGCGVKHFETTIHGPVSNRIRALIESGTWSDSDDICAVSDYGRCVRIHGEETPYDLGEYETLYQLANWEFADVSNS